MEVVRVRGEDILLFAQDKRVVDIGEWDRDPDLIEGPDRGHKLKTGDLLPGGGAHGFGKTPALPDAIVIRPMVDNPIDPGAVLFELVKVEVVLDEKKDHQRS